MTAPQDDREAEIGRIAGERDAAVSARQEAERVLADIVPAYHIVEHGHVSKSWEDCPLDRCSSARATIARTREPAGEGTE